MPPDIVVGFVVAHVIASLKAADHFALMFAAGFDMGNSLDIKIASGDGTCPWTVIVFPAFAFAQTNSSSLKSSQY